MFECWSDFLQMYLRYLVQGTTTILGAIESECLVLYIDILFDFPLLLDSPLTLIMTFAHALKTGNATLADGYVGILVFFLRLALMLLFSMTC